MASLRAYRTNQSQIDQTTLTKLVRLGSLSHSYMTQEHLLLCYSDTPPFKQNTHILVLRVLGLRDLILPVY